MRKKLTLVFSLFLTVITVHGQLRHIKGDNQVIAGCGIEKNGYSVDLAYNYFVTKNFQGRFHVFNERLSFNNLTKASTVMFCPEIYYTVYRIGEDIFFDTKAGLDLGGEKITNNAVNKSESNFVIGESIGAGAQLFVIKTFAVHLEFEQRLIQLSKVGNAAFKVTIGVSYLF